MNGNDITTDVMPTTILADKFVPERPKKWQNEKFCKWYELE